MSSKLCGLGIHALRHVGISPARDPLQRLPSWWHVTRCKRCHLQRARLVFRYPRLIRTHDWGAIEQEHD